MVIRGYQASLESVKFLIIHRTAFIEFKQHSLGTLDVTQCGIQRNNYAYT